MEGIVLNKLVLLLLILFSISVQANVRFCSDPTIISNFLNSKTNIVQIQNCAKIAKKNNLGFKNTKQVAFILDNELNDKLFYFSFPMIHEISFYKFTDGKLLETKSYSKNNNEGNEYVYFDNIGEYSSTIIAITNTQNSIQFPYILFDSRDEFQSFVKERWMFDGIWFGVVFGTILLTMAFFCIRKKVEIIYYSMHIFALFIIQMAFSGYLFSSFNYLPKYLLSRAVVFACSILTFGTVGLIYKTFLDQRPNDKLIKVYGGVKILAVIHFVACLMFFNQTIIKSTSYLTLILSLSSILICLYAIARRLKYSGSFLLSFSLFLFSSLAFTLKDLGVMNINEIQVNYLVKISLLVEIFILGAVIVRRLFEEAKIITNASMHQMITNGNIKIIKKLQHDIDSPLTSLEFFMMEVRNNISEDLRLMGRQSLNRIQDIINTLKINEEDSVLEESSKKEVLAIYPILKRIVSEKRIEYKNRTDVFITLDTATNKDYFVEINKSDFYRAISNIINNAVEAKKLADPIYIKIKLEKVANQVSISISDNGVGIDSKYIKEIFEYGKSFNKNSSGIGLNQAKDYIESESGKLTIDSSLGEGTIIQISLNVVEAPIWYSNCISLSSKKIVVVDDDQSIHNLWNEKLLPVTEDITHLYSSEEFEQWASSKDLKDYYFLVDLELIGSMDTGINLINAYQLQSRSVLVTSHFMDTDVQSLCTRFGIKMIPKESVLNISVNFAENETPKRIVLIDDDRFTHLNWKRSAKNNGIELLSFYSVEGFLNESHDLDFDIPIYVDSNLGDGLKGEILSEDIYNKGFKNIILATGAKKEDIKIPFWIKKVQGKGFYVQQ
jgi:signal transduction histidine kinase